MTNYLIRSGVALTTALAFVAAGVPAQARDAEQGNNIQTAPQSDSAKETAKRYCFVSEVTGSRIPVKICKTRKEWEAEGVAIPAGR